MGRLNEKVAPTIATHAMGAIVEARAGGDPDELARINDRYNRNDVHARRRQIVGLLRTSQHGLRVSIGHIGFDGPGGQQKRNYCNGRHAVS